MRLQDLTKAELIAIIRNLELDKYRDLIKRNVELEMELEKRFAETRREAET